MEQEKKEPELIISQDFPSDKDLSPEIRKKITMGSTIDEIFFSEIDEQWAKKIYNLDLGD